MSKAENIFEAAFLLEGSTRRTEHSNAFKNGAMAALLNAENIGNITHRYIENPYPAASAEYDAWHFGYGDGRYLWRVNSEGKG